MVFISAHSQCNIRAPRTLTRETIRSVPLYFAFDGVGVSFLAFVAVAPDRCQLVSQWAADWLFIQLYGVWLMPNGMEVKCFLSRLQPLFMYLCLNYTWIWAADKRMGVLNNDGASACLWLAGPIRFIHRYGQYINRWWLLILFQDDFLCVCICWHISKYSRKNADGLGVKCIFVAMHRQHLHASYIGTNLEGYSQKKAQKNWKWLCAHRSIYFPYVIK